MEILKNCDFWKIEQCSVGNGAVRLTWKPATQSMRANDFQEALNALVDYVRSTGARTIVIDTREFQFALDDSLREWRDHNITPEYNKAGVTKCAYLLSHTASAKLPSPYDGAGFATQFFSDQDKLDVWLHEQ